MAQEGIPSPETMNLLALAQAPGLGPVLIGRLVRALGSAGEALRAPAQRLGTVEGIGPERVRAFMHARAGLMDEAHREVERAREVGARVIGLGDQEYGELLGAIADAPPVLFVRGRMEPGGADRYALAVVGSRSCTPYGREQTARFAGFLASSGVTIVSGGARGIDTAAHRAALQGGGRTIAVLGSGIAVAYPPENRDLFDEIAASGRGAVVSALPVRTAPAAENFPARNRVISGLALGVLVVEAARGSGSLITARLAAEEHGREVFAVPGRVDSPASEGTHELLKAGGAHLVTAPGDVLEALETPARHAHGGTFTSRYQGAGLFAQVQEEAPQTQAQAPARASSAGLSPTQGALLAALDELGGAAALDRVLAHAQLEAGRAQADLTVLELRRLVRRSGQRIERA
jgi:DNA processing protein